MIEMSPEEIVTEITMSSNDNPFFIVEGNDDYKFFSYQEDFINVNILPAFGTDNVISVINICEKANIDIVLGIIDRDYRIPLRDIPESKNIVYSDLRDFECMVFSTDILEKILTEKCSLSKLNKENCKVEDIRDKIIELAIPLGNLRFYSAYNKVNYKFDKIDFEKIFDSRIFVFDEGKFANHFRGISTSNKTFKITEFESAHKLVESLEYFNNPMLICSGHDLMNILSLGLRKKYGSKSKQEITLENIQEIFRISYSKEYYSNTLLFKTIKEWVE